MTMTTVPTKSIRIGNSQGIRLPDDLFDRRSLEDPYPLYRRLRETAPVCRTSQGRWLVSRHGDALALLSDRRCDHWGQNLGKSQDAHPSEAAVAHALQALSPGHAVPFRQAAVHGLTAAALRRCAGAMVERAEALLRGLRERARIDLVADYAHPFTFATICQIMGLPDEDVPALSETVGRLDGNYLRFVVTGPTEPEDRDGAAFVGYLRRLLAARRKRPGPDLVSRLLDADRQAGGEPRSDDLFVNLLLLLFFAGHQNMMNFISLALLTLYRHPDSCEALRRAPESMPDAVEELMRYDSPVQYIPLFALEDVPLHGRVISPGEEVWICVGAANRDPTAFADPESLDLDRRPKKQLSFGWGPYRCIGAQLAGLQGATALTHLLARIADFRVADEPLRWRTEPMVLRGLHALPLQVSWHG